MLRIKKINPKGIYFFARKHNIQNKNWKKNLFFYNETWRIIFNYKIMATITIENVPDNIVKAFWTNVNYKKITESFLPKKRIINRLKGLSLSEIEEQFYDKKDDTYWPFVNEQEFITFLDRK